LTHRHNGQYPSKTGRKQWEAIQPWSFIAIKTLHHTKHFFFIKKAFLNQLHHQWRSWKILTHPA
jgi:hypothetical protein